MKSLVKILFCFTNYVLQCTQGNLTFLNKGVNIDSIKFVNFFFIHHHISLFFIFQNPKTVFISMFKSDFESQVFNVVFMDPTMFDNVK